MKQTFFLLLALFTFACSETKQKNSEITSNSPETSSGTIDSNAAKTERPAPEKLPSVEKDHLFSHPTEPDHFKLEMHGTSLLDSYATFTITNPQGRVIYEDSISSGDLEASMVYEMETPIANAPERETFIRKRIKEFFDDKYFTIPAIAPNDSYDQTFGDEHAWNTIKADPRSVGFHYLIGKENGRIIAYSKQDGKVMVVGYFGG